MKKDDIRWTFAIVDRKKGAEVSRLFHEHGQELRLTARGHGTANSAIMDCLGLDEPEKDIVLGLGTGESSRRLLSFLDRKLEFHRPGHGIAYSISLLGISLGAMDMLKEQEHPAPAGQPQPYTQKEDTPMTHNMEHELITAIIDTDLSVPVMDAARKAGCHGGTLLKARDMGAEAGKRIFGMTLSQEKSILLILTSSDCRQPILKAICETVLKETGEHAIAFSLPVSQVVGLSSG